ncbi:C-type lectin domain family 2 member D-like [Carettochelys insculpta]|uniref:C-type lectin domain family 2 member D-like n=1 Tax=Carettochelys insculpta TaxID=44489 RepID=UPI003EBA3162
MCLAQRSNLENSAEEHLNHNGDPRQKGQPGCQHWAKPWECCTWRLLVILLFIAVLTVVALSAFIAKLQLAPAGPPAAPGCTDGWIGYLGKCYYFSEAERNWSFSQSRCSAFGATLAVIDTLQEKDFLLRYTGLSEHWIGLQREEGQPWRWVTGAEFTNLFEVRANGRCAYLNDNAVSSSWCQKLRKWICSQWVTYAQDEERANVLQPDPSQ